MEKIRNDFATLNDFLKKNKKFLKNFQRLCDFVRLRKCPKIFENLKIKKNNKK
jgi:hypothetical protein